MSVRQPSIWETRPKYFSEYGVQRKKKGYTLRMLIEEVHFLEQPVYDLVQKNWGTLDITTLGSELNGFQKGLHAIRLQLMEPFAAKKCV